MSKTIAKDKSQMSRREIMAVFAALMMAMFIGSLDQTVVSTALPTIVGDLGGVDHLVWVTSAYMLCSTVMMPIYGRLGDTYGRKYLFGGALGLFTLGSLICGLGDSMAVLIGGRAIQGLGGGGLMILSQAIIADIFPPKERGKYMGIMGAAFGVSAVLGPLLGGWFTDSIGWRWCFWVNIPLCVIAFILALKCLPHNPRGAQGTRFDIGGTIAMAISTSSLIIALSWGGNVYEWSDPLIISLFVIFAVCAVLFVIIERHVKVPLIPLNFFTNRTFATATATGLLIMVGMMGVVSYMPTYIQITQGFNATVSAYLMLPMMIGVMITSTVSGFVASKARKIKWMPIVSCLLAAVACGLLSTLTVSTSTWVLCIFLFILGFGIGIGQQILVLMVQNEFSIDIVGTATSANNFFREIGGTVGATVVGSIFTSNLTSNLTNNVAQAASAGFDANAITPSLVRSLEEPLHSLVTTAYNDALTPIFFGMIFVMLLAAVCACFIKEVPLASNNAESGSMHTDEH
jgi:EmrB/QacA subfamily drug resistance transporter